MITEVYTGNSPLAEELITKWNEKYDEVEKLKKEMNELKSQMKKEMGVERNKQYILIKTDKMTDYVIIYDNLS